jgi:hypothetical protein
MINFGPKLQKLIYHESWLQLLQFEDFYTITHLTAAYACNNETNGKVSTPANVVPHDKSCRLIPANRLALFRYSFLHIAYDGLG